MFAVGLSLWVGRYVIGWFHWVGKSLIVGCYYGVVGCCWSVYCYGLVFIVISSLLSIEPRPGMPLQGQEQQEASLQRMVGIGAKFLDRNLGNIHYSHYLCNSVMELVGRCG